MRIGFDNDRYLKIQSEHIKERINQFGDKLYLEFGGKLFDDYHASRVLPGFAPDSKLQMLMQLADVAEIVIVISAADIEKNNVGYLDCAFLARYGSCGSWSGFANSADRTSGRRQDGRPSHYRLQCSWHRGFGGTADRILVRQRVSVVHVPRRVPDYRVHIVVRLGLCREQ